MIGSLFSGIGGLELGLERAGLGPVRWQVEIDGFFRAVLAEHWPKARRYEDVRKVGRANLAPVDLVCGGFPCQDVSSAGRGAGLDGSRSGLWTEFRRVVGELRPRFVVVENVASGKARWLPHVRHDLLALGYRSVAVEVSAFDVGAPHRRARVFVVASNADGDAVWIDEQRFAARRPQGIRDQGDADSGCDGGEGVAADADSERCPGTRREDPRADRDRESRGEDPLGRGYGGGSRPLADADREGKPREAGGAERRLPRTFWEWARDGGRGGWTALSPVRGVANGVPRRLDRLRALGNAVVPQCAEAVGRMIVAGLEVVA